MKKALEDEVRRRANGRCEYCHFPESVSELKHSVDHIVAQQHNGPTTLDNLCVCCGRCNRHKGPNIAGVDPQTGKITRLFNPRTDLWHEHFHWNGARLSGRTDVGRATIEVLSINHPYRVAARQVLISSGRWKPD
jgi:hypothetical protein